MSCAQRIGCMCVVLLNSVKLFYVASYSYLRQTKWVVCEISVWAHYEIMIERLIDRSLDV